MSKLNRYSLTLTNGRFNFAGKISIGKKEALFILLLIVMLVNEKHEEVLDLATQVGL